jgi:proline- and glutamine-rich splicing factor
MFCFFVLELRQRELDRERQKREWEMKERQAEEQRLADEERMRRQQEEMQLRMHHQEEEMRRRQQENTLFMQVGIRFTYKSSGFKYYEQY